jgi:hypothetical protein
VTATAEPAAPPGTPAARYEDLPRPAVLRSAEDLLRAGFAVAVLAICLAGEWYATRRIVVGQDDLVDFVSRLPEPIGGGVVGASQLLAVLTPVAILAMVLWRRSGRLAVEAVLAAVLSAVAEIGLSRLVLDSAEPRARAVAGFVDGWLGTPFPGAAYLAAAAGVATVGLAWVSRGWRRAIWGVLLGVATMVVLTGNGFVVTTIAALATGAAVGSLVVLAIGGPDLAPRAAAIAGQLGAAGLDVVTVVEITGGRPPARHYRATQASGVDLFVKVLDDDARTRDLLLRTWQRIRLRAVGDEQPVGSLRQAVEHEAFVALWAARSGVRTADVAAVESVGRGGMLIAQRFVDGTPLDAVAEAGDDDAVVAAWRILASLHAAGIAHGPLDARDILIDVAGRPWPVDMDHASLGAPPARQARDVADLLTSTAIVIGPDRAIAAAAAGLEPADLAACLPYLQKLALSPRVRRQLKRHKGLLEKLRVGVVATTGAEDVPLEKLERFSRKTVIRFALVFLVLYFLLPQLGNLEDAVSALGGADWRYIALAFIYIPTNYFAASLRMVGSIPDRLPFGPVYTLQMASAFMNRVTPNNVGGMTLTVRFLQKAGVPTETAAASVGIQSVMTWAGLLVWLAIFFLWAGRTGSLGFSFPIKGVVLLVIVAAIAVGATLWVIPPHGARSSSRSAGSPGRQGGTSGASCRCRHDWACSSSARCSTPSSTSSPSSGC